MGFVTTDNALTISNSSILVKPFARIQSINKITNRAFSYFWEYLNNLDFIKSLMINKMFGPNSTTKNRFL